jgi:hypothetical protein
MSEMSFEDQWKRACERSPWLPVARELYLAGELSNAEIAAHPSVTEANGKPISGESVKKALYRWGWNVGRAEAERRVKAHTEEIQAIANAQARRNAGLEVADRLNNPASPIELVASANVLLEQLKERELITELGEANKFDLGVISRELTDIEELSREVMLLEDVEPDENMSKAQKQLLLRSAISMKLELKDLVSKIQDRLMKLRRAILAPPARGAPMLQQLFLNGNPAGGNDPEMQLALQAEKERLQLQEGQYGSLPPPALPGEIITRETLELPAQEIIDAEYETVPAGQEAGTASPAESCAAPRCEADPGPGGPCEAADDTADEGGATILILGNNDVTRIRGGASESASSVRALGQRDKRMASARA